MDIIRKEYISPQKNIRRKPSFAQENYYYGTNQKKSSDFPWKKILGISVTIIFTFGVIGGGFFFWKIHTVSNNVRIENTPAQSFMTDAKNLVASVVNPKRTMLRGEEDDRINILMLGAAGKGKPGQNLTDTIMIMSIDTKNKRMGLLSLPRDLYVNIPDTNYSTKINSLYQYGLTNNQGIGPMKKAVEEITNLTIDYFLVVDFDGFKQVIDDIGGINITVERDIYDPRYPGPNYSYETFEISKGLHQLDGATALKYVRERHNDPEGDFGRAKRQQQVIQSTKNKIFSIGTFLNVPRISNLLDTLGENIKTDIEISEVESFIALAKEIDTQNIANTVVDAWKKESLLKVSHVATNSGMAFILVPRIGTYAEIQDLAKNIFNLNMLKRRKEEIKNENANIIIYNRSKDQQLGYKLKKIIQDRLEIKNVTIAHEQNAPLFNSTIITTKSGSEKLFTLDELIKKIPATLGQGENGILNKNTDFAIFIGRDAEKTYSFAEDNVNDWKNSNEDNQKYFNPINN